MYNATPEQQLWNLAKNKNGYFVSENQGKFFLGLTQFYGREYISQSVLNGKSITTHFVMDKKGILYIVSNNKEVWKREIPAYTGTLENSYIPAFTRTVATRKQNHKFHDDKNFSGDWDD